MSFETPEKNAIKPLKINFGPLSGCLHCGDKASEYFKDMCEKCHKASHLGFKTMGAEDGENCSICRLFLPDTPHLVFPKEAICYPCLEYKRLDLECHFCPLCNYPNKWNYENCAACQRPSAFFGLAIEENDNAEFAAMTCDIDNSVLKIFAEAEKEDKAQLCLCPSVDACPRNLRDKILRVEKMKAIGTKDEAGAAQASRRAREMNPHVKEQRPLFFTKNVDGETVVVDASFGARRKTRRQNREDGGTKTRRSARIGMRACFKKKSS